MKSLNFVVLNDIWQFAIKMHEGQMYGVNPYSVHLAAVAQSVIAGGGNTKEVAVAYLHDVLEDTDCTLEQLTKALRGDEEAVAAVVAITKVEGQSYLDYIRVVKKNTIAHKVKIHDTLCNLTESVRTNQRKRITKYVNQLKTLTDE